MESLQQLVKLLNKQLNVEHQFNLDLIHETPSLEDGKKCLNFIGFASSITNDTSILPQSFKNNYLWNLNEETNLRIKNIKKWININIFTSMLEHILNEKCPPYSTDYVRLRIATNLIDKLNLPKDKKLEWIHHLHNIYQTRRIIITTYYEVEIAKLPF